MDDVWCWSVQGRRFLLKSGARTEFLLFKNKLLSSLKPISKWINLLLALHIDHSLASLSDKVKQTPKFIESKCFKCCCLWIMVPVTQPIHADCNVVREMISISLCTACSSWKEAVTNFRYPSKEKLSFEWCFRLSALQLSARSMAFSGRRLTAATAVVWAAQTSLGLRFGHVVLRLLTLQQSHKERGLCHLPSSH